MKNSIVDDTTPFVFVISDTKGHVFGAVCSCVPNVTAKSFVGDGESMLFSIRPQVKAFPWTGFNNFFATFNRSFVSVGGSKEGGKSGLWFDSDLLRGRSGICETYNNDVLSSGEDFEIYGIEVWSFIA